MQVRLLGPVDVAVDGVSRPVQGLRRKAVLAVLALHRGEIVSAGRLVDIVWGESALSTGANTLQSNVSHLRHVLGSKDAIRWRPPGYALDLGADGTDVQVAERLIQQGTQSSDHADRVRHLEAALALWRGRPLMDVTEVAWLDAQSERLDQLWLQAVRSMIDARLALGEHVHLVPDLEGLARDYPFDEQIHGQLMRALYRAGRQADALAAYDQLRHALDDDLGIDPSQAVRDLQTAILRQDPALDWAPPAITVRPAMTALSVPAQLPMAIPSFAGRSRELSSLDALLTGASTDPSKPAAEVISVVSGTAGVGKTALAVNWAHRVADQFPDGQLYVNLRGFDPGGSVQNPADAVRGFLDAFGVPVQRIPAGLDAQAGLYRSLLAGKRVLVVLDNARDVEQVRPLLPGGRGCLVVVTSRNQLTALVAIEGAKPLTLDVLSTVEANDLLVSRLGADRTAAEPSAARQIIARCARLPLALAIACARAATHPEFPLAKLAAELDDATSRLDAFQAGDAATDVRAVFSWSHQTLSAETARLFRLLGLHPGVDITAPAAASLAGITPQRVRPLLIELTRAHLVNEHAPGRYTFHDLLRAYAAEQAHIHEDDEQRYAAVHRVLDHYLHTAYTAALVLNPQRVSVDLAIAQPGVQPEGFDSHDSALAWFAAEHAVLLATVERAATAGFDAHAWQLAWALRTHLFRRGHWHEQVAVQHIAVDAAERLNDRVAQGHAHRSLAKAYFRLGNLAEAHTHYLHALDVYTDLGDLTGQALIDLGLREVAEQQGRLTDALEHAEQALDRYSTAGYRVGQATALNAVGWSHAQMGDYHQAFVYCRQAVTLLQDLDYRDGEAAAWDSLGHAYRGLGDFEQAAACYQHAIDLFEDLGDSYNKAVALASFGDTHDAASNPDAARTAWQKALGILDELNHPDAEMVRAKLRPRDDSPARQLRPPGDRRVRLNRPRDFTASTASPASPAVEASSSDATGQAR